MSANTDAWPLWRTVGLAPGEGLFATRVFAEAFALLAQTRFEGSFDVVEQGLPSRTVINARNPHQHQSFHGQKGGPHGTGFFRIPDLARESSDTRASSPCGFADFACRRS